MNISEVKERKKKELENSILELVDRFENDTETTVKQITVYRYYVQSAGVEIPTLARVDIEIEI